MTTNRLPIKLTIDKEDLDDDYPIEFINKNEVKKEKKSYRPSK
jgi:hypothetical protein